MLVDLPTLLVVTAFASAMSGMLLAYAWLLNRHAPAIALWALAYLVGSAGIALIIARDNVDDFWSIDIANALLIGSYGLMWTGARNFDGRRTPLLYAFAGVAVWLSACQIEVFYASMTERITLFSAINLCYTTLTGFEFWRYGDKRLMSRWPLIVILGVHAGVFLSRIVWPGWLVFGMIGRSPALSLTVFVSFEVLFHTFCAAFLLSFITKERIELRYKRASLVDPLTGILNRRGFMENAARQLGRVAINHQPAALIAFDLDRFKALNDTYGHPVGDRVLCTFCDVVNTALRPGDLFGRIGGEEFACLLLNISQADAIAVAERIRSRFADREIVIGSMKVRATASAGVAFANEQDRDLHALILAADQTLYRAKERGRNRIETTQPTLVLSNEVLRSL
jgi:diguanylate cyclase (GGDEF)-like protein